MIPVSTRKNMVDRDQDSFSICHQCELLSIARSTLYYTPSTRDNEDLSLMKELDNLYLEDPTRGALAEWQKSSANWVIRSEGIMYEP